MEQETIKHDRLFKELLKTFFVEFLELFFPSLLAEIDTSYLEFLEQEIFTELDFEAQTDLVAWLQGVEAEE
ncbi:MAG: hypothetical protein GDA48_00220 [Hormoscilla sp. GM102CHS1]|nr:hypothetical protein [Hormoscilla sp. GM102CHS1]